MGVFSIFGLVLVPAFQAASDGLYPIDMSFPTTPEVIYGQLARYSEESRRIYRWFFLVDLIWPPLLASLFSLLWCWLAARTSHALPTRLIGAGILLLPWAEALLDWTENLGFITLIESYPTTLMTLAWLTGMVKHLKLLLYALCWLVTLVFAALAVVRRGTPRRAAGA
ncbi:MAG: hypothetical protein FJ170_03205 [Gammaproteobacteria bacterium]|nr:hypothetical protein [Gammaproteobacteria bacterium]